MQLIDKRKAFFILQHIAQKRQIWDGSGGILDPGTDDLKPFLFGLGADGVVDAVGIIVPGHRLPEAVERNMVKLCEVVRVPDIGKIVVDYKGAGRVEAYSNRQLIEV